MAIMWFDSITDRIIGETDILRLYVMLMELADTDISEPMAGYDWTP